MESEHNTFNYQRDPELVRLEKIADFSLYLFAIYAITGTISLIALFTWAIYTHGSGIDWDALVAFLHL